jgi:hypothetical protein
LNAQCLRDARIFIKSHTQHWQGVNEKKVIRSDLSNKTQYIENYVQQLGTLTNDYSLAFALPDCLSKAIDLKNFNHEIVYFRTCRAATSDRQSHRAPKMPESHYVFRQTAVIFHTSF